MQQFLLPVSGSLRGGPRRSSTGDALSLRDKWGVPVRTPGHQQAAGCEILEGSQGWGAGLDTPPPRSQWLTFPREDGAVQGTLWACFGILGHARI